MPFAPPHPFTTRPTLRGTFGMVASTHWIASQCAQAVLERGGNAFDAAVAAGFVLHIVEPHLNGPGGDLVALVAPAGSDPRVLAGQGPAPAAASAASYRALGLDQVPGSGYLAAAVPGAVDAWLLLLRDHGSWELPQVWEFARDYARHGHPLSAGAVAAIDHAASFFVREWPTSARQWLPEGRVPDPGELIRNEVWADTLDRLLAASSGSTREERIEAVRAEWGGGFVAARLDEAVRSPAMDTSGSRHGGVLVAADLARFEASWERPVSGTFRGRTILKPGSWSQGPALLEALAILDGFTDEQIDPSTEAGVHRIVESLKLAYADRDAYYGDGALAASELAELLSPDYAVRRRAEIGQSAVRFAEPGTAAGLTPRHPPRRDAQATATYPGSGEPALGPRGAARGDTCHLDVVDRWGNMVSATPSGGWLQSSPYVEELGFALGTRLQMTRLEEGTPTTLTPGRRPRTTLTPTLVLRDGVVYAALGSPGGDQQDQWQSLFLIRHLAGGFGLQESIDAPAFHTTALESSFWPRTTSPAGLVVEGRVDGAVVDGLRARGHRVTVEGEWSLGRLSVVTRRDSDGMLSAAANPRGAQGYAVGR